MVSARTDPPLPEIPLRESPTDLHYKLKQCVTLKQAKMILAPGFARSGIKGNARLESPTFP